MKPPPYKKAALLICMLILITAGLSLGWIILKSQNSFTIPDISGTSTEQGDSLYADIYQNGVLLESISLSSVEESYTFIINGDHNCFNQVEVNKNSIGISAASCPDKLCVHQGFISTSLLPITCLPNKLVIQIREEGDEGKETEDILITPDIITY